MAIIITIYSAYHINTHTNHAIILPKIYQKTFHHMASASNKKHFPPPKKKRSVIPQFAALVFFLSVPLHRREKLFLVDQISRFFTTFPQGNGPNFLGDTFRRNADSILFLICAYEFFYIINI